MSFTSDIKQELTKIEPEKKCCQLAEIAGFLRFAGSITLNRGGFGIKITTENPAVARMYITLIKDYFGTKTSLSFDEVNTITKERVYELNITPELNAEQMLREVGILGVKEGSNYITDGISSEIIRKRCCKKAALRGIFLASGSIADPAKGYHLEIVCASQYMAGDVKKLVNSFGLKSKVIARKEKYVVYIKEAEQISDFMNAVGASGTLFRFQKVQMTKEMKNMANRISNCDTANMNKTIDAAQKQLDDIRVIEENRGLEVLPDRLYITAKLRKENPELSLAELAELFDPPLKKSGLNHRFEKIAEMAAKIKSM